MYMLEVRDSISVLVRIDSVQTVPNRFHGEPELSIRATLRLSPNAEADREVILWAEVESLDKLTVSDDFIARDVKLEGHCSEDHANPYARASVGISAIWFGESSDDNSLALVMSEA
jgi:hypothetical protein